ncbi:hypothetical protein MRB53_028502 [Persea americana]|uniref:Uncharacterized protein n=1 Tax=Persea americana TaxID=3435 RepID=A0ACC2KFW8_PERAE|nr:hypothetical protein MRB53_028502 [Persea americana]
MDAFVAEEELVLTILRGLPKDYDALYIYVTSKADSTTPDELHGLLLSQETRIDSQQQEVSPTELPTTALYTAKPNSPPTRGRGRNGSFYNNRGRGRGRGVPMHLGGHPCGRTGRIASSLPEGDTHSRPDTPLFPSASNRTIAIHRLCEGGELLDMILSRLVLDFVVLAAGS